MAGAGQDTAQRFGLAAALLLGAVVAVLIAVSWGDDADDPSSSATTTRGTDQTDETEPPGTDTGEVRIYLEELLIELDEVTDSIVRDPAVALEADSEEAQQLRDVFAPGSPAFDGAMEAFRRDAGAGTRLEPLEEDLTSRTRITGDVEPIDENTVRVPVCYQMSYRKLDRTGGVLEFVPSLNQPGEVEAVRVDGSWKIQSIDQYDNTICDPGEEA